MSGYFGLLEVMKLLMTGFAFSMIFEGCFILTTLALVIVNFSGADDTQFRILSVFVLHQGYFHFILYLRLFDLTAVLVSALFYICKDIMIFSLIFFVGVIAHGNMFYVMQGVAVNLGHTSDDS
jgi:hypothetical protein